MKKLIKNYTTDIPVERTISEIQQILARNGARGVALEYDDGGTIKDVFFKSMLNNKELPFRLPVSFFRINATGLTKLQRHTADPAAEKTRLRAFILRLG